MKIIPIIAFLLLECSTSMSCFAIKVPKRIGIEHYTNTYCSVCANRNPGFRANLNTLTDYTYMSIHPSSPYPACTFNKANISGNDGRTKFWNIYGGTPRLVINGSVIPSSNDYSKPELFQNFKNDSTNIAIEIRQRKSNGTFKVRIILKALEDANYKASRLFVAMVEDTIAFLAPNGESKHRNVFRQSLSAITGDSLDIVLAAGDSLVYTLETDISSDYKTDLLKAVVFLYDANRMLIQSNSSERHEDDPTLVIKDIKHFVFTVYPNPSEELFIVQGENTSDIKHLRVLDLRGRLLKCVQFEDGELARSITLGDLPDGIYILEIDSGNRRSRIKLIKGESD